MSVYLLMTDDWYSDSEETIEVYAVKDEVMEELEKRIELETSGKEDFEVERIETDRDNIIRVEIMDEDEEPYKTYRIKERMLLYKTIY